MAGNHEEKLAKAARRRQLAEDQLRLLEESPRRSSGQLKRARDRLIQADVQWQRLANEEERCLLRAAEEERQRLAEEEGRRELLVEEAKLQRVAAEEARLLLQRETLVSVIESLQSRIKSYEHIIGANETRTRMTLIDPLLCALGWDTSNPSLVIPEFSAGGGLADYALLKMTSEVEPKPIALIEAKRLSETLAFHLPQMLNYANMSGVKYAGLTNGDRWQLYDVFKEAPLDDRRILDVSLRQTPAVECAIQLLKLGRPNLETGEMLPVNEPQYP